MGFSLGSLPTHMSEVKEVWESMDSRSWGGLVGAIQKIRETEGNTGTLDKVEQRARNAEREGEDFPVNFRSFVRLLR